MMRLQRLLGLFPDDKIILSTPFNTEIITVGEACWKYLKERQKSKRQGAKFLKGLEEVQNNGV